MPLAPADALYEVLGDQSGEVHARFLDKSVHGIQEIALFQKCRQNIEEYMHRGMRYPRFTLRSIKLGISFTIAAIKFYLLLYLNLAGARKYQGRLSVFNSGLKFAVLMKINQVPRIFVKNINEVINLQSFIKWRMRLTVEFKSNSFASCYDSTMLIFYNSFDKFVLENKALSVVQLGILLISKLEDLPKAQATYFAGKQYQGQGCIIIYSFP